MILFRFALIYLMYVIGYCIKLISLIYYCRKINITLSFRWGRGAVSMIMLFEDDNDDNSLKERLPKQSKLVKVCLAGVTLNKGNTVIMKGTNPS